jgi:5-methyltetrahydrofolate--homocysteine methyltransferase
MKPFLERLQEQRPIVGDGALGTMLLARGLASGQCPETWNLSRPEVLREIAAAYVEAGSELVAANTFGASPLKLAQYGLEDQTEAMNLAAVEVLRAAVGDRAYIAACCGPCGKLLKPYGDTEPQVVQDSFRKQMSLLIGAGVNVVFIETMIDLAEAVLAIKAAKDVSPGLPVVATMTFDASPRGFFTVMGTTVEKAAVGLKAAGADVIGSNCGNGIVNMVEIARRFRKCSDLPLILQSNAGLPEVRDGRIEYPESPEFMASKVKDLLEIGVSIIGGCCGTTPAHIRGIVQAIGAWRRS